MKKVISSLLVIVLVYSMPFVSLAASKENEFIVKSKIITVREDVTREEAVNDIGFNVDEANKSDSYLKSRAVTWNVWGTGIEGKYGATPVGYSQHLDGDTVLETYHYTRTYLGEWLKFGDSGRVWGHYTVRAEGEYCDYDTWGAHTHVVKYGTET